MRTSIELRRQILSAARAEFAAYGLAGARVDRIARAADASKERLYAHFGDKEALFREVAAADGAELFRAVTLRPDAVPDFVGDLHDLAQRHPEHLRMLTWARLEGMGFDHPPGADAALPGQTIAAIRIAQDSGHVDPAWDPEELLVLLFGIAMAWAHWPGPRPSDDHSAAAHHRRCAVEAAARIITTPR
ncbi:TetR family transcriptional regulator [Mycolicibacterium hippocampi]|uniref:TetR family transcriptional regulator n=1 Tax=Mycolicibacterium hippocampi TaxID=659824 RepID=UPI0035149BDC